MSIEAMRDLADASGIVRACGHNELAKRLLVLAEQAQKQEPVAYTGNGTAGRESDVRPTGFFFQADKKQEPVGEVYGWHGHGVGQPLCRFNVTEADMPVGSLLYTSPPQRQPLAIGKESDAFKAWFDAVWIGDGEQGETIPTSGKEYDEYLSQYTLAFGAWMAAKEAAHGIKGEA